jgi:hypothetical protein
MKRYFLVLFFLFITIGFSFAQDVYQIQESMDFFKRNQFQSGEWKNTLTENDIQGSPYLNDEFIQGTIFTTSKTQIINVPLRYNIYNDQLEFKTPNNEIQAMAAPEIIEKVDFGDFTMVYVPYTNVKKIRRGFFKVLQEGNASLYSRSELTFKQATEPAAYKDPEPAKFVNNADSYYIRIGMEQARKVGSKKELITIFPDHLDEITAFIKKNKIKTNNPEKLKKLVNYYNSL